MHEFTTLHRRAVTAALGIATLTLAGCGIGATHRAGATGMKTPTSARAASMQVVVGERATAAGEVLVTSAGRTLYTFAADHAGLSACVGTCAANWPPLLVPQGERLSADPILPGPLSIIVRADGQEQATYDARPLYAFTGDQAAGQANGQGVNNLWFAARVDGLESAPAPMASPTPPAPPVPVRPPAPLPPVPIPPKPAAPSTPRPAPPTVAPQAPSSPIPQGGAGDGDADNSGGPNDGDGNK